MTPEESAAIDAWVAEQLREPWPLDSVQLATIRDALGDSGVDRADSAGASPTRNRVA